MDTLAYLPLAEIDNSSIASTCKLTLFKGLKRSTGVRFLSLALALTLLSTATSAMALQRGDRGSSVTTLQQNLAIAGYFQGPATGLYGSLTQDAVRRFQRDNGLIADGVAGSQTLAALENRGGGDDDFEPSVGFGNATLQRGSKGNTVSNLQRTLKAIGYYNGPVTGYYGSLTQASVIKFQRAKGLVADGIVGARTKALLSNY